jgi:hypothetical protein
VGGVVLIGGSVVVIVGSGGTATPFVLMGATMALGAGVTGVTVGSFQLTQPVSQDNARLSEVTRLTMDLGSSPARLLAGTAGAVYTGDEAGLRSGVNIGGKIDLAITFGSGLSTLTRNIAPPNQPTGIPTWTIQYTPAAATDPNAANFLRLNAEWLQAEEGYVVIQLGRGDAAYRAEDAALRGLANKSMPPGTTGVAMHPADAVINPYAKAGEIGTTYYFGPSRVNTAFGGSLGNAVKQYGLKPGDKLRLEFSGYPSYDVAPPYAPPASAPDLKR